MFLNRPPEKKKHLPHIVRIKSGQTLNARLAGDPLRCFTHYADRRTYPCVRNHPDGCPLCAFVGNPRYYAYWPISGSTGLQAAVELTELAEWQLLQILERSANHFGHLVTFHRPSGRRNNPVQISTPAVLPKDDHARRQKIKPLEISAIQETLFRLWDCPERHPLEPMDRYLDRVEQTLHARYSHRHSDERCSSYQRDKQHLSEAVRHHEAS